MSLFGKLIAEGGKHIVKKKSKIILLTLALIIGMRMVSPGFAISIPAFEFSQPTVNSNFGDFSLGFEFKVSSATTIAALGFYDDLMNGLSESHDIGIYDLQKTLLVSGTVPAGTVAPLAGWFRYTNVSPISLPAGNYVIAVTTGSENYTWNPVDLTWNSPFTFVRDKFAVSDSLIFPDDSGVNWKFDLISTFGPNMRTDPVPAPEPPTLLLLASGLLGILGHRYRFGASRHNRTDK